jgi:predicted NAD/FAD-dependent oxidoreductase
VDNVDVAIVGAGVSGLTAARALSKFKSVVIEKEASIGGRVKSAVLGGHNCDLGAITGYDPKWVPFVEFPSPMIYELGPIALMKDGYLFVGNTPDDCVARWLTEPINPRKRRRTLTGGRMPLPDIIAHFFGVIHAGEMEQYSLEIQKDALRRYYFSRHEGGNYELIEELARGVRIHAGCSVTSIEKVGHRFRLATESTSRIDFIEAKSVIIATPASNAALLCSSVAPEIAKRLATVEYAPYLVVALAVTGRPLGELSYLVIPPEFSTIVQLRTRDPTVSHVLIYVRGQKARKMSSWNRMKLTAWSKRLIAEAARNESLAVVDVCEAYWLSASTIITDQLLESGAAWETGVAGLFIAGDYSFGGCYGLKSAIQSGQHAAKLLSMCASVNGEVDD